jgi:hypothetical protein
MLSTVEFDGQSGVGAEKIHFHLAAPARRSQSIRACAS